jgi:hypothetical protein
MLNLAAVEFVIAPVTEPARVDHAVHSRRSDILVADHPVSEPWLAIAAYRDAFGNQCHRVLAPPGRVRLSASGIINDSGRPDEAVVTARQDLVQDLPDDTLVFLLER